MKFAILLSGQPVFFSETNDFFLQKINKNNTKIFSHIWWNNCYANKPYKLHFSHKTENENADSIFIKAFKIDEFMVEEHKTFDLSFVKEFNKSVWPNKTEEYYKIMVPIWIYGFLNQTYSVKKAFSLIKNENFDIIIKTRPDVLLTKDIFSILENIKIEENTIYFQSSMNGGHVYAGEFPDKPCDWFFAGTKESMKKFCNSWHSNIYKEFEKCPIHTNEYLKIICQKENLKIVILDFGALIFRQLTDFYKKYLIEEKFYIKNFNFECFQPENTDQWPYWVKYVDFSKFKNII